MRTKEWCPGNEAEVGRVRIYGTPRDEPMGTRSQPIAATGSYRLAGTGETGRYNMQQSSLTALRRGARIWVLRPHGRDILFARVACAGGYYWFGDRGRFCWRCQWQRRKKPGGA